MSSVQKKQEGGTRIMIKYTEGYKYQLAEDYIIQTEIYGYNYDSQFLKLTPDGKLLIRSGYAWDGASGTTKDDKTNMESSLVHDALYQLMRQEAIPRSYQKYSDKFFKEICIANGMGRFRAWYYHFGLQNFGKYANNPKNKRKIITT